MPLSAPVLQQVTHACYPVCDVPCRLVLQVKADRHGEELSDAELQEHTIKKARWSCVVLCLGPLVHQFM